MYPAISQLIQEVKPNNELLSITDDYNDDEVEEK